MCFLRILVWRLFRGKPTDGVQFCHAGPETWMLNRPYGPCVCLIFPGNQQKMEHTPFCHPIGCPETVQNQTARDGFPCSGVSRIREDLAPILDPVKANSNAYYLVIASLDFSRFLSGSQFLQKLDVGMVQEQYLGQ